jgi:hypothetical protein
MRLRTTRRRAVIVGVSGAIALGVIALVVVAASLLEPVGPVAVENQASTPLVIAVAGVRDGASFTHETFAVPARSRVVIGRDGLAPLEATLLSADCSRTLETYSLDTGMEGGSITIAPDGAVSRQPGGVPWFGDNAVPATCPSS